MSCPHDKHVRVLCTSRVLGEAVKVGENLRRRGDFKKQLKKEKKKTKKGKKGKKREEKKRGKKSKKSKKKTALGPRLSGWMVAWPPVSFALHGKCHCHPCFVGRSNHFE